MPLAHKIKEAPQPTAIIALLNQLLANTIAFKLSAKQAHWNVRGANFIALHELFDKVSSAVDEYADMLAEPLAMPEEEEPRLQVGDTAGLSPPGSIPVAPSPMPATPAPKAIQPFVLEDALCTIPGPGGFAGGGLTGSGGGVCGGAASSTETSR